MVCRGKHIGEALCICFWCLFWPVSHDSWLNHVLGEWLLLLTYWSTTSCWPNVFAVRCQRTCPWIRFSHR